MSDNIHCSDEINFYPPTPENLLQNYNKREAGVVRNLIAQYKSKKDTSEIAITDVARHIFLMYHLDPRLIGKASYGGDKSKAKVTSNKKIKSIDICIAEKKSQTITDVDKAYGNDTFLHEMLHALVYVWEEKYGSQAHVGHGSKETKEEFEKCRELLVNAIYQPAEQTMPPNNEDNEIEHEVDDEE